MINTIKEKKFTIMSVIRISIRKKILHCIISEVVLFEGRGLYIELTYRHLANTVRTVIFPQAELRTKET